MDSESTVVVFAAVALTAGASHVAAFDSTLQDHPLGVVDFQHIPEVADVGAGWIRVPVEWRYIEPEDDAFNWSSGFAAWLDAADAAGLNVSPVVWVGRMWASGFFFPAPWPSWPPLDLQETFDPEFGYSETYYDFMSRFLEHYGDRIDRVTIENEVNARNMWMGSMDDYRRLLATAAKARDDVAPSVRILDSGIASGAWGIAIAQSWIESGTHAPDEVLRFANEWYRYDVYAPYHWDDYEVLAHWLRQPFVQGSIANVEYVLHVVPGDVDAFNLKFAAQHWLYPHLIDYIETRMAEGGHSVPVLINNEASNWPMGDAVVEAQNLFKLVVVGLSRGVVRHLWFPWTNENNPTPRRGLLDEHGQITAQYEAFRNVGERLGAHPRFAGHDILGADVLRYRFRREGELEPHLDAMWWDDGEHGVGGETVTIPLPAGTEHVIRYGYDGMPEHLAARDSLRVWIDESGCFLEYVPGAIDVADATPAIAEAWIASTPNPFIRSTIVHASLDDVGGVAGRPDPYLLRIYDPAGRLVRRLRLRPTGAGEYAVSWDGADDTGRQVAPGPYWGRLDPRDGTPTIRMLRLR